MTRNPDYDEGVFEIYEYEVMRAQTRFNEQAKYIQVEVLTIKGFLMAFQNDIQNDLVLIQLAVMLVGGYTLINLGSCSPIHCRISVSVMGLLCVGLCYFAGFSIAFNIGLK